MTLLRRTDTDPSSDEELVALLRQGHQPALGILWDRYAHLLFGVGMKYLKNTERSKDLVVELFATLGSLVTKQEIQRFRPWLHTVMRNNCLMLLRKQDTTTTFPNQTWNGTDDIDHEDAILHESTLQRLESAISELKDEQRICIELFYLKKQSYQQVAERTQQDIQQVRSHLQNGRRNLRLILERSGVTNTRSNVR
ncbi:MAG: sigma-70 family RNA polymerase sigma factor [Flavobacteriales bacterium]|nr:sigma-70 family RNA polymerase sigma factor [Flavobacteriales bacterium]MBK6943927.1 sigma-70 family RNA polymerase sigma factor [Flavobacteriales bacterium]MBK7240135.1 sigma-70 family RNA polymerase sigma factor [Flavobacteriales bacterium]MBK9533598.1 sigma-70 family RNA polymerase sigma factor [Flavobacteriales bacterium]MBP9136888.1 sigma-70 family RNA polymerase sigma factor [Flavobacteriales bacterium]